MRPCFKFKATDTGLTAVVAIDDDIGFWGVQAKDFRAALDSVEGDDLIVEINSLGGDVMAGLGMYNMIRNSGKNVTTRVTGLAASIASIVMLAGDKREMPSNAFAMVHSVKSGAWGTADEIRDQADVVDKVQTSLRNIYVNRMGIDEATATEIMSKDTWLTADECLAMGFVTAVVDPVRATASFDMDRAQLPAHVKAIFAAKASNEAAAQTEAAEQAEATAAAAQAEADAAAQAEADAAATAKAEADAAAQAEADAAALAANPLADQIVASAKAAGLEAHATVFALSCTTMADAQTRMASAREIVALCTLAKRPDDAGRAIRSNTPVATVREQLIAALAEADEHTDGIKPNKADAKSARSGVDPKAIWTSHLNQQPSKGR